jgi:ABC-type bacteriocin/lantibiotic exporter with double-glycine peptidase domain
LYEIDMDGINVVLPLKQQDSGCGPACLQSGIRYLGGPSIEQTRIAEIAGTTDDAGTPPHKMVTGARQLGYRAEFERRCSFDDITAALKQGRVPIVSWFSVYTPHWSVVDTCENGQLRIMDPEDGSFKIFPYEDFNKVWFSYPATQSISGENLRIRPMLVLGKK